MTSVKDDVSVTSAVAAVETNTAADATEVKPVDDIDVAEPTGTLDTDLSDGSVETGGWGFFSFLVFLALVASGALFWWMGGIKWIMRMIGSSRDHARYRKVDDVEK